MAGNYPDYPNHRIPYDKDGTRFFVGDSTTVPPAEYANSYLVSLNQESNFNLDDSAYVFFAFPEALDITAMHTASRGGGYPSEVATSVNSTNGIDGTWVARTFTGAYGSGAGDNTYRLNFSGGSWPGTRWLRFYQGSEPSGSAWLWMHLFATVSAGQNEHKLELWHPTNANRVPANYFDWGNVPRSSTADITFRVKNLSSVYTANSITVSIGAPYDATPSVSGQHTLSQGGSFTATQVISSLAPGALSGVLTLRRITPNNAVLSVWAARLNAAAASWT